MLLCEHLDSYQCVAINPVEPKLVAVSNAQSGSSLYDTRNRKEWAHKWIHILLLLLLHVIFIVIIIIIIKPTPCRMVNYKGTRYPTFSEDGVSVCFNSAGTQLFSMYRRNACTLHNLWETSALCIYSDVNGAYRNSVTMKSGCFMGQDDEVKFGRYNL